MRKFKVSKKIVLVMSMILVAVLSGPVAFAEDPQIVTSTKNFFTDLGKWILILTPVAGGTMIGYHGLMKALSDGDPSVTADKNKKMINVLKAIAIVESAVGIVTAFAAYFQGK